MYLFPVNLKLEKRLTNTASLKIMGKILPGVDIIGKGYDVRGEFAKMNSVCSQPLFNFGAATENCQVLNRTYSIPPILKNRVINQPNANIKVCTGKSLDEYKKSLTVSVSASASYAFFSGSLKSNFNEEDFTSIGYDYATVIDVQQLWRISLPPAQQLKPYLTPEVKNALDNPAIPALQVLNTYGAYYLGEIIMGGRLDYNSASKTFKWDHKTDLSVTVEAAFKASVLGASTTASTEVKEEVHHFEQNSTVTLNAVGGTPQTAARVALNALSEIPAWAATLIDYPSLADFTPNSLRPIWELCSSQARANELAAAFPAYLQQAPGTAIKTQLLRVVVNPPMAGAGADHGSGANIDISVYKPYVSDGWKWVGQYAQGNYAPCSGHSVIIEDIFDLGLLREPIDYGYIWNDSGSGKPDDYNCWRPIPPQGYKVLGDIMRLRVGDQNRPSGGEIANLVCVREEFTVPIAGLSPMIWNDHGTHAHNDLTVYKIVPPANGLDAGTYAGYPSYNAPDKNQVDLRCLVKDPSKIIVQS